MYGHYRKSDCKLFYIGMGSKQKPYFKCRRSLHWKNIVNKHGFFVKILHENLTKKEAQETEIELIAFARAENVGLCNISAGGDTGNGLQGLHRAGVDKKIYTFYHINGETYTGTRIDFRKDKNISSPGLNSLFIKESAKSWRGWSLSKDNFKIYTFYSWTGDIFTGTKTDFKNYSALTQYQVNAMLAPSKNKNKTVCCNGWSLVEKIAIKWKPCLKHKKDLEVYVFYHSTYGTETCTRQELSKKYNINPLSLRKLFVKTVNSKRPPSCLGWILLKDDDN